MTDVGKQIADVIGRLGALAEQAGQIDRAHTARLDHHTERLASIEANVAELEALVHAREPWAEHVTRSIERLAGRVERLEGRTQRALDDADELELGDRMLALERRLEATERLEELRHEALTERVARLEGREAQ